MSGSFAGTPKQLEIMDIVLKTADQGRYVEFHELRSRLSYGAEVTKQAIQCSIRFLEKHGYLSREYDKSRKLYLKPTLLSYQILRT